MNASTHESTCIEANKLQDITMQFTCGNLTAPSADTLSKAVLTNTNSNGHAARIVEQHLKLYVYHPANWNSKYGMLRRKVAI